MLPPAHNLSGRVCPGAQPAWPMVAASRASPVSPPPPLLCRRRWRWSGRRSTCSPGAVTSRATRGGEPSTRGCLRCATASRGARCWRGGGTSCWTHRAVPSWSVPPACTPPPLTLGLAWAGMHQAALPLLPLLSFHTLPMPHIMARYHLPCCTVLHCTAADQDQCHAGHHRSARPQHDPGQSHTLGPSACRPRGRPRPAAHLGRQRQPAPAPAARRPLPLRPRRLRAAAALEVSAAGRLCAARAGKQLGRVPPVARLDCAAPSVCLHATQSSLMHALCLMIACRAGVDPLVIHATFQRYPVSMHQSGKRARFRWAGGWRLSWRLPTPLQGPRKSWDSLAGSLLCPSTCTAQQSYSTVIWLMQGVWDVVPGWSRVLCAAGGALSEL